MNDVISLTKGDAAQGETIAGVATFVTDNYFGVLGVQPIAGVVFPPGSERQPVAIIGHHIWDQLFAKSPNAIGSTLIVNGLPVTIVGVAPAKFVGLNKLVGFKIWMPLASRSLILEELPPDADVFAAIARLRPGVGLDQATAAVRTVAANAVTAEDTESKPRLKDPDTDVVPLRAANGDPNHWRDVRVMAIVFTTIAFLILLVTCTNVSAILAGLAVGRRREIVIRLSLGAARSRIIRQLLTESVLLGTTAGVIALSIVWLVQRFVNRAIVAFPLEFGVSLPAALFTFGIALAVGILFGLSPAMHATRVTVATALRDSAAVIAASHARLQRALVITQIAFTQPLIVGVATSLVILLGSYQNARLNDASESIISMRLMSADRQMRTAGDSAALQQSAEEIRRLRDRLQGTRGITGAVQDYHSSVALEGYTVHPEDRVGAGGGDPIRLSAQIVAPGHFAVVNRSLVLGRDFTPSDTSNLQAATRAETPVIIGSGLAKRLWPGTNPIGRRLQPSLDSPHRSTLTVAGVVAEVAEQDLAASSEHHVFVPPNSAEASSFALLIGTSGSAVPLIPTIRAIAHEASPGLTVTQVRTFADMEAVVRNGYLLATLVFSGAGLLALLISAIGLYAVVALSVGQRSSEIAVRMAIGARALNIVRKFVGEGVRLSIVGVALGLPLSLAALRFLTAQPDMLPHVSVASIGLMVAVGVLAVAAAAAWIPARRAAGIAPASILRKE